MLHATTGLCNPTPTLPPTMHRRGRGFSGEVGGGSAAAELNMLTLSEKFMAGARHCCCLRSKNVLQKKMLRLLDSVFWLSLVAWEGSHTLVLIRILLFLYTEKQGCSFLRIFQLNAKDKNAQKSCGEVFSWALYFLITLSGCSPVAGSQKIWLH